MLRQCTYDDLDKIVEFVFQMNNQIEHHSAFCPLNEESIRKEFELSVNSEKYIVIGNFRNNKLTGLLSCYFDKEKGNADCLGPFIDSTVEDYLSLAMQLFDFIKNNVREKINYTFFFSKENIECMNFLESIAAGRKENEYELLLKRENFIPHLSELEIEDLDEAYYQQFKQLHDVIFPNVYVSGKDIIEDIDNNRFVFSIIEEGRLAAYSVLKICNNSKSATAEIIAVDENYRGKGYGRAMLNYLIGSAFQDPDIEEIELIVDADNEKAISLYTSIGFIIKAENCCYVAK